ncbi:hypothetical protein [Streptomyces mirabilis]|uniref:hypothetical protein n=1 Tax=Streptomyces mirabilis TaxID=68239 RepID=UPI0036DC4BD8
MGDTTVSGTAVEQLLVTEQRLTRVRAEMNTTISDRSSCSYESAFGLMGGGDLHRDAHIDVAAVALDSRGSKDLTGANGVTDDHGGDGRDRVEGDHGLEHDDGLGPGDRDDHRHGGYGRA